MSIARLQQLQQLRVKILGNLATRQPRLESKQHRYLDYYPPDVNYLEVSKQDKELSRSIRLVDVPLKEAIQRENKMVARGKNVRVSVLGKKTEIPQKQQQKKKKKK